MLVFVSYLVHFFFFLKHESCLFPRGQSKYYHHYRSSMVISSLVCPSSIFQTPQLECEESSGVPRTWLWVGSLLFCQYKAQMHFSVPIGLYSCHLSSPFSVEHAVSLWFHCFLSIVNHLACSPSHQLPRRNLIGCLAFLKAAPNCLDRNWPPLLSVFLGWPSFDMRLPFALVWPRSSSLYLAPLAGAPLTSGPSATTFRDDNDNSPHSYTHEARV